MSDNFFEIKNVDFKIGNKVKVKNVSFSIEKEGDIICLLGPSGIGKTTILRALSQEEPPVLLLSQRVEQWICHGARQNSGWLESVARDGFVEIEESPGNGDPGCLLT